MAYIGNEPSVNFTSFAKQDLTGVTGSPTAKREFTLTHAVANANEIEVFVNNVRQEPTESYTVNGTGLTMTGDVETTDDFYIIYLGKAIQTTVPPDGSVSTAKIASSAVDLTSKVTGVLPVANGGTGVSTAMADQWRLTGSTNQGTNADVTSNWARVNNSGWGGIGTGMTESSGIFSFPSTGTYLIMIQAEFFMAAADDSAALQFDITLDNSSYQTVAQTNSAGRATGDGSTNHGGASFFLFDVTNITTHKFKFSTGSMGASTRLQGSTTISKTGFTVIRIGA